MMFDMDCWMFLLLLCDRRGVSSLFVSKRSTNRNTTLHKDWMFTRLDWGVCCAYPTFSRGVFQVLVRQRFPTLRASTYYMRGCVRNPNPTRKWDCVPNVCGTWSLVRNLEFYFMAGQHLFILASPPFWKKDQTKTLEAKTYRNGPER